MRIRIWSDLYNFSRIRICVGSTQFFQDPDLCWIYTIFPGSRSVLDLHNFSSIRICVGSTQFFQDPDLVGSVMFRRIRILSDLCIPFCRIQNWPRNNQIIFSQLFNNKICKEMIWSIFHYKKELNIVNSKTDCLLPSDTEHF